VALLLALCAVIILMPAVLSAFDAGRVYLADASASSAIDAAAARLNSTNASDRDRAIEQLGQAARSGSAVAVNDLTAFFQRDEMLAEHGLATARALAASGSRRAYQVLIEGLGSDETAVRQYVAMASLEQDAQANVTPLLVAALRSPDAGVRTNTAQLLGYRHETTASDALLAATYDDESAVREAAVWSLGSDLNFWQSLPRMQLLSYSDPDARVRDAAARASEHIRGDVARTLGIAPNEVLAVTTASSNGLVYVATQKQLYVVHADQTSQAVSTLPDVPMALAAGGTEGQQVYLGTVSEGLYRSLDGGATWERAKAGLPDSPGLIVTALAADPTNAAASSDVYMALGVTVGSTSLQTTPLGIYRSTDRGATWARIDDGKAPLNGLTTALTIDPATPSVLIGQTDSGAWRADIQ
jgi:hypothetical protein